MLIIFAVVGGFGSTDKNTSSDTSSNTQKPGQHPEIEELYIEDDMITIKTSPAKQIIMSCGIRRLKSVKNKDGSPVTKAQFKIFPYDKYVRFTVRDFNGNNANTNAYSIDTLLKYGV